MAYKPDKHGRDHCPGGEDPIPCLGIPVWASTWDAFVDGQTLTTVNDDVRVKMTGGVISDNGDDYFAMVGESDTDLELDDTIYGIKLLQDGLYLFTLRVRHQAPNHPHFKVRYFYENIAETPGSVGGSVSWDFLHHADAAWTDWQAIHMNSWILPIKLGTSYPNGLTVWMRMLLMSYAGGTGDFSCDITHKNLFIVRMGGLDSTRTWPISGIGA